MEDLLNYVRQIDGGLATVAAVCLQPLAVYIFLSGLDDVVLDLAWLFRLLRRRSPEPLRGPNRRIALMIPCWHEQDVIARMVEHNRAAIRYSNYEVFIGTYRNDAGTQSVVRMLQARDSHVHLAVVPHDGPTVKADCLNWVYQCILEHEERTGDRFELLLLHDAEDLVHPDELETIDRYATRYDMIQVPVLPLATPWREFTHGIYCDDFAESQGKDLESRQQLGGFLPGCGVGTGWRREALEELARLQSNRLFAPDHLTEDYENGLRLHELGFRQIFVPCIASVGTWRATREYFPRRWSAAVRQRSRWVTGGALQTWERWGWKGGLARKYFFWRDRKGLWGNPVSLLCNLLLVYGLLGRRLEFSPQMSALLWVNFAILAERMAVRTTIVARFYGWRFAAGVPLRMLWGNLLNFSATRRALWMYFRAKWRGEPLVWMKTQHTYPNRAGLQEHRRTLAEVLVTSGYLEQESLDSAVARQPAGARIEEFLVAEGLLSTAELSGAQTLLRGAPPAELDPADICPAVTRVFPREFAKAWKVLPFRIAEGALDVASPEPPGEDLQTSLRRFTRLELRFHHVSIEDFEELASRLL